jgi:hypothetical protein
MEAVRGRVEADVRRHAILVEQLGQGLGVGHLVNQTPPPQVLEQTGHGISLPRSGTRAEPIPTSGDRLRPPAGP